MRPSDQDWYLHVEFDVDFARDDAEMFGRHTATSAKRLKKCLHGLEPIKQVKLHPSALPGNKHYAHEDLFEDIMDLTLDDDRGYQTNAQKQQDFVGSLRFHSVQHHVASCTSLLDSNHSGAKVLEHSKIRQLANSKRERGTGVVGSKDLFRRNADAMEESISFGKTRSKYTKPTVDDNMRFMQHTKSHKIRQETSRNQEVIPVDRKTHHQLTTEYMQSLRSGDPSVPIMEKKHTKLTYNASDGNLTMLETQGVDSSKAQVFPEHLRHRIRGSKEQCELSAKNDDQGSNSSLYGTKRQETRNMSSEDVGFLQAEGVNIAAKEDVDDLLRSYQEVFHKNLDSSAPLGDQFSQSRENIGDRGGNNDHERFSQFSEDSSPAPPTSNPRRSGSTTSTVFQLFDGIDDEEPPEELPASVEDPDLKAAWKYMTREEKRQSIHYFFPRGNNDAALQRRKRE